MVSEILALLDPHRGGTFLDGTVGGGGHAEALLSEGSGIWLVGVDRDPDALRAAQLGLARFGERVRLIAGDFCAAPELLDRLGPWGPASGRLTGALLDLGVSSHQIDKSVRGFSFRRSTPLDMRMGGTTGGWRTAADLLNEESEEELGRMFREFGEQRSWKALAREVVARRKLSPLRSSDDLIAACEAALGRALGPKQLARLFQAVRIAVNRELEALREGLEAICERLETGGRLAVIAYHSLEDRIVKRTFQMWSASCICPPELPVCRCRGEALGRTLTRRPLRPSEDEVRRNPRARSARLRGWERG